METLNRRAVAKPSYRVAQTAPHQILVCNACKQAGSRARAGAAVLQRLRAAVAEAGLGPQFEVSGTACLAGCGPAQGGACVVGLRAGAKATWLFGQIDPAQPMDDLIAFARLYAATGDGWLSGKDCPPRLCDTTLARIPAALAAPMPGNAP